MRILINAGNYLANTKMQILRKGGNKNANGAKPILKNVGKSVSNHIANPANKPPPINSSSSQAQPNQSPN